MARLPVELRTLPPRCRRFQDVGNDDRPLPLIRRQQVATFLPPFLRGTGLVGCLTIPHEETGFYPGLD